MPIASKSRLSIALRCPALFSHHLNAVPAFAYPAKMFSPVGFSL